MANDEDFLEMGFESEPVKQESQKPEPVKKEPPKPEPIKQEAPKPEPMKPEILKPEPVVQKTEDVKPKKKFFGKQLLTVAAFIFIGVFGVSAASYYYIYNSPKEVIRKMMLAMNDLDTVHYRVDFLVGATGDASVLSSEKEKTISILYLPKILALLAQTTSPDGLDEIADYEQRLDLSIEGDIDYRDLNDPRFSGSIISSFKMKPTAGFDISLGIDGELRYIDKNYYFKVIKFPGMDLPLFDVEKLKNRWVKIDVAELAENLQNSFGVDIKESENKEDQEIILTEEQKEELKQLVKDVEIFKVDDRLKSEYISGVSTRHYKVTVDLSEFKRFVLEANKILDDKAFLNETQRRDFENEFDDIKDDIKYLGGELWIGKKDYLLRKAFMKMEVVDNDTNSAGLVGATIRFSRFNQPVDIGIPDNASSLEKVLSEMFGDMIFDSPSGIMPDGKVIEGSSSLLEFYGEGCSNCEAMSVLVEKLEKEEGVDIIQYEVFGNAENYKLMQQYDQDYCGGVPFFFDTKTNDWICGATSYENLKSWALGL
jgi:thiol-disulfide isomerase/thioredoxin